MTVSTLITISPEELTALVEKAVAPYIKHLTMPGSKSLVWKHAYTVREVAHLINYHPKTVLTFIHEGRKDRRGRITRLKAKEITPSDYRITNEDLEAFIGCF